MPASPNRFARNLPARSASTRDVPAIPKHLRVPEISADSLIALLEERSDVPAAVRAALATDIIDSARRYQFMRLAWKQARRDDGRDAGRTKEGIRRIEALLRWLNAPMAERTFEEEELAAMTELLSCHLDALRGRLRRIGSLKAESKRPIPQELANLEHAIVAAFVRYRVELTNKAAGTFVAVLEHVYHEIGDSNRDARTAARRLVKGLRRT